MTITWPLTDTIYILINWYNIYSSSKIVAVISCFFFKYTNCVFYFNKLVEWYCVTVKNCFIQRLHQRLFIKRLLDKVRESISNILKHLKGFGSVWLFTKWICWIFEPCAQPTCFTGLRNLLVVLGARRRESVRPVSGFLTNREEWMYWKCLFILIPIFDVNAHVWRRSVSFSQWYVCDCCCPWQTWSSDASQLVSGAEKRARLKSSIPLTGAFCPPWRTAALVWKETFDKFECCTI